MVAAPVDIELDPVDIVTEALDLGLNCADVFVQINRRTFSSYHRHQLARTQSKPDGYGVNGRRDPRLGSPCDGPPVMRLCAWGAAARK